MEGHTPYYAPSEYLNKWSDSAPERSWGDPKAYYRDEVAEPDAKLQGLMDSYDGSTRYLDSQLRRLIESLQQAEQLSETIVVVTSDHGEAFGEHDLYGHLTGLYDELVRVPLLIRTPNGNSRTIKRPVSNQWLMPTLLNRTNADIPKHCINNDLLGDADGPVVAQANADIFPNSTPSDYDSYETGKRMLVSDDSKLIETVDGSHREFYELGDEDTNLVAERPGEKTALVSDLEGIVDDFSPVPRGETETKVDQSVRNQLRELGYVN